jgi:hypothetical protein
VGTTFFWGSWRVEEQATAKQILFEDDSKKGDS